jgi:hypothetical protein
MNKKFAVLLFALGLGAATAPSFADETCGGYCLRTYFDCVNSGADETGCRIDRIDCYGSCGI